MTGTDDVTQTAGAAAIRVIAADDQRVVREGLALILSLLPGVEVAGTAANGEEALALAAELKPDVVLMDLRMPGIGGVEAIRRIRAADPSVSSGTSWTRSPRAGLSRPWRPDKAQTRQRRCCRTG
jgi:CheY-like chemotaxis protein